MYCSVGKTLNLLENVKNVSCSTLVQDITDCIYSETPTVNLFEGL